MASELQAAFAERLKTKEPARRSVDVLLKPHLAEEQAAAEAEVEAAESRLRGVFRDEDRPGAIADLERAQAALADVNERVDEATLTFWLSQVPRPEYDALVDEFPATDKQRAEIEKEGHAAPPYDTDLFPPALIAAATVQPVYGDDGKVERWERHVLSREDSMAMWDGPDAWPQPDLLALWTTAFALNLTRVTASTGKGRGSASTTRTGPRSGTATSGASPTASS